MKIRRLLRSGFVDQYHTRDLQNVILNLMLYIDELCVTNNIEYYIIGGTALGAIRHGGFIPWDDDLDIAMTRNNYKKFIEICKSENFDTKTYYLQEERRDWTGYFSKIRLLGTYFEESSTDYSVSLDKQGVFVDVFPLDNVPDNKLMQYWWYFCGKILVAYEQTTHKGYEAKGLARKIAMFLALPLKNSWVRHYFERQVERYNDEITNYIGGFSLVSRIHNTFTKRSLWGKPIRVPFETVSLLAPENITGFLTFYFGDYMKLPPEESRRGHHMVKVDYGIYKDMI